MLYIRERAISGANLDTVLIYPACTKKGKANEDLGPEETHTIESMEDLQKKKFLGKLPNNKESGGRRPQDVAANLACSTNKDKIIKFVEVTLGPCTDA